MPHGTQRRIERMRRFDVLLLRGVAYGAALLAVATLVLAVAS